MRFILFLVGLLFAFLGILLWPAWVGAALCFTFAMSPKRAAPASRITYRRFPLRRPRLNRAFLKAYRRERRREEREDERRWKRIVRHGGADPVSKEDFGHIGGIGEFDTTKATPRLWRR